MQLPTQQSDIVHVAVAVVTNQSNEVLIALRPDHVHQGGLWEFPGGKVESGETVLPALKRELREEIGIEVQSARPFIRLFYEYPEKHVLLDVWLVTQFSGIPHGREGQPVKWVQQGMLGNYSFPAANLPITTALNLPSRYLITPSPPEETKLFVIGLENSLKTGIKLLQLRAPQLQRDAYLALAEEVLKICQKYDVKLMLNADPALVEEVGAHGVHLNASRLLMLDKKPLRQQLLVSASCHNADEIAKANQLGVDFAVLGPVLKTKTHPGAAPLGWEMFHRLTDHANFPVYALGGLSSEQLDTAYQNGAQGIAAIRSLWGERTI